MYSAVSTIIMKKVNLSGTGRKFVFRKILALAGTYREKNPHACRAYPA